MRFRHVWFLLVGLLLLGAPAAAVAAEGGGTAEVTVRVLPPADDEPPPEPPGRLPITAWGGALAIPMAVGGVLMISLGVLLVRRAR